MSSTKNVKVEMVNALTTISAIIDHHSEAIIKSQLLGNILSSDHQMTQDLEMNDSYLICNIIRFSR